MNNNGVYMRIQLMKRFVNEIFSGDLEKSIDQIPVSLFPRNGGSCRCCTYKERAIARYRLISLLGFRIEEEEDETRPLASYAREAAVREGAPEGPVMTLIDAACHSCPSGRHTVSNLCRGCPAQHCHGVCPKGAVSFPEGRALIDHEKCVNCGKCREACPYNAVVYTPVPCEESCPAGAIRKGPDGAAVIDFERCISCGRCSVSCPFGAVSERSHLFNVARALSSPGAERPVALLAPAAAGQFPGSFGQLTAALKAAGFAAVIEVALGAAETVRREAEELKERLASGRLLTSSCCPAYTEAVRLHCREIAPFVSHAPTPMAVAAEYARERRPGAPVVFIGPCSAKRLEARRDASADLVLTFEELAALFLAAGIDVAECPEGEPDNPPAGPLQRRFASSGGVQAAVLAEAGGELPRPPELLQIDGLDRKGMAKLKLLASGKIPADFVEVMSCPGGCICGPGTVADPRISLRKLQEYAGEELRAVRETEAVLS